MAVDDIMELMLFIVLVVLPLLGVTMRFTLKPLIQAVIQLSEGLNRSIGSDDPAALERMQEELSELHHKVAELEASNTFYRELVDPQSPSDPTAPIS